MIPSPVQLGNLFDIAKEIITEARFSIQNTRTIDPQQLPHIFDCGLYDAVKAAIKANYTVCDNGWHVARVKRNLEAVLSLSLPTNVKIYACGLAAVAESLENAGMIPNEPLNADQAFEYASQFLDIATIERTRSFRSPS